MISVTVKIFKDLNQPCIISLYLGVFNRVSTAEKRRRELQMNNPNFIFINHYEDYK